jgi:GH15 family glucan-1,4-alpha-glucosidase
MTDRRVLIRDYGLIGDTRTAALVAPDGAIDWCCLPRFDDAPVFGRLVGGDEAGWFALGPATTEPPVDRRYNGQTATLITTWRSEGSEITLEDSMVAEVSGHLLPTTVLRRRLSCRGEAVVARVQLAPRFGYRREPAHRVATRHGALVLEHGSLVVAVTTNGPPLGPETEIEWRLTPDHPVTFVLSAERSGPAIIVPPAVANTAVDRDERGWATWCTGLADELPHSDLVVRSLLTLQLLTYSPSGAPVAAPTSSLPEEIGGSRNWDYRYAWPRDAAIGIGAFTAAGRDREATAFLAWLLHATRLSRHRLPAVLTLDGRRLGPERELSDWPGYAKSRPVRHGNGASTQHQLDGYGWVVDAAWALTDSGHELNGETWRTVAGLADHVASVWRQPDAGIWERREAPAHHVHSKLMGWLALDRAVRIAERRNASARRSRRWQQERDAVAAQLRAQGFDERLCSYTGAYGCTRLDAAVLLLPLLEFEPPDSPRVAGTIDAIRERLSAGGALLHRYEPGTDGLEGREGAFLPCSFWLVQALARTGRVEEAHATFDELTRLANPLGLYAEEIDPVSGEHLGNFPQALTHASLIQAARALGEAGGERGYVRVA